jgi:putative endonuclease
VCSAEPARRDPTLQGADSRRALGRRGEALAASHLLRLGFAVLERNARTRFGEIDLIVCDAERIVFVEVKARMLGVGTPRTAARLQPLEWLRPNQRVRLRRLATAWLAESRERPCVASIRFDAIGVVLDAHGNLLRLDHLEDAW